MDWHAYTARVQPFFWKLVRPSLRIGRSMTEVSSLRGCKYFPRGFHKQVDTIWVPAPFLKNVFAEAGVPRKKIQVAVETVDLGHFEPGRRRGLDVPADLAGIKGARWYEWFRRRGEAVNAEKEGDLTVFGSVAGSTSERNLTARIPSLPAKEGTNSNEAYIPHEDEPCQFIFLSIFKWEARKDPETLIKAFLHTFGVDSGVCLLISSKDSSRGVPQSDRHNRDRIYSHIRNVVENMDWNDTWTPLSYSPPHAAGEFPPLASDFRNDWLRFKPTSKPTNLGVLRRLIKVTTSQHSWDSLPGLYRVADAYVSSSHGEGWGLPAHEALAMELPVVAPATTGHLAFLDMDNSWPVALELDAQEKTVRAQIPEDAKMDFGPLATWDQVDWKHLSATMLSVALLKFQMYAQARDTGRPLSKVQNSYEIYTKPKHARERLKKELSQLAVIKEWMKLLGDLVMEKLW
ncbi:hypothetical protein BC830DRAFT_544501 [Chytriomyces sp. MP71]|nr:hypothetical protein BC830DRAFT_544501 [Chytriomyces sp. MP71]